MNFRDAQTCVSTKKGYPMKFNKCVFQYLCLSLFFVFISTAAVSADSAKNPNFGEDALRTRVKLYWDKKISSDYDGLYQLEADVNKKRYKLPEYRKIYGDQAAIVGYTIGKITIDSEKKEAAVSISYEIELKIPVPQLLGHKKKLVSDDTWLFENDNWFHVK